MKTTKGIQEKNITIECGDGGKTGNEDKLVL